MYNLSINIMETKWNGFVPLSINVRISRKISFKYIPVCLIDDKSALIQVVTTRSIPEPKIAMFRDEYASQGPSVLMYGHQTKWFPRQIWTTTSSAM